MRRDLSGGLIVPDLAADPTAPPAGSIAIYGRSGKATQRDSSGAVIDLAAGGSTAVQLAADQAFTATALANVTGLVIPVTANQPREFEFMLSITSAVITTGWQFGFTFPAAMQSLLATCEYQSSATAWTTATISSSAPASPASFTLVTAAYVALAPIAVRIKGVARNGVNAGNIQLQAATEVAASAVTVKAGSVLKYV